MKGIILAAGRGSRMKSLTDDRPKCLVEFRGQPLLVWQLDALRGAGVTEIAIVLGYRGDLLRPFRLHAFENPRWAETQMVTSLACAADWLASSDCIVTYADLYYQPDAVSRLLDVDVRLGVAYDPDWLRLWTRRFADPLEDAETFRIDGASRILEIGGKPASLAEVQGQYMGLLRFSPEAWSAVEEFRRDLDPAVRDTLQMTWLLQGLITSGFPVIGVPVPSAWGEIDSEEDLAAQSRSQTS